MTGPAQPRGVVLPGAIMEVAGAASQEVVLTIGATGFTADRGDGSPLTIPWERVDDAHCGQEGFTPDGQPAVAVSATVGGRFVRWVVPGMKPERATALNMLIDMRLRAQAPPPPPSAPAQWAVLPRPGVAEQVGGAPAAVPAPQGGMAPGAGPTGPGPGPAARTPGPGGGAGGRAPSDEVLAAMGLPPMAPIGGWDRSARTDGELRMRRMVKVLVIVLGLLLLAALVVLVVGLALPDKHHAPPGAKAADPASTPAATRVTAARALARAVRVSAGDLPTGWAADATGTSPLTGLLPTGTGSGLAPGTHVDAATAARFASCLGTTATGDVIVGRQGSKPLARASSPLFTATPTGGAALGVASVTSVYRTDDEVKAAGDELADPQFAHCLGVVVGQELEKAAASGPEGQGASFGTLTVKPLTVPTRDGIQASGVDMVVPVTFSDGTTKIDVSLVLVAGGRVESTLVSYAAGGNFPATLRGSLTSAIEGSLAANLQQ